MPHLDVSVRLNGCIVHEWLGYVQDEVLLGDAPGSVAPYPGPPLLVRRHGNRLQVRGRWLDDGKRIRVRLRGGTVEVLMGVATARRRSVHAEWVPDLRLLVATAAVVLSGAWWEAATSFVRTHPVAAAQVASLLDAPPAAWVWRAASGPGDAFEAPPAQRAGPDAVPATRHRVRSVPDRE